eukprot:GHVL01021608.1.p1 GENE.GHVL01021608.1~~GHVL01021608.1.p1  ORF type:complete len:275 (+),score=37.95 GHVL01021608.1:2124-2948(+)
MPINFDLFSKSSARFPRFVNTKSNSSNTLRDEITNRQKGGEQLKRTEQIATEANYSYLKTLECPDAFNSADIKTYSKKKQAFDQFQVTEKLRSYVPQKNDDKNALDSIWKPTYFGEIENLRVDNFGAITAINGDLFERKIDCILIPMVSNFMPARGLGLDVLELGGPSLIKECFVQVREALDRRRGLKDESATLQLGDTFLVKRPADCSIKARHIAFVITPYYWQGSRNDAARRLRLCIRQGLEQINRWTMDDNIIESVCIPSFAGGLYGMIYF